MRHISNWSSNSLSKELKMKIKMVFPDMKPRRHWQIISIFLKVDFKDFSPNMLIVNALNFLTHAKFLWKRQNESNLLTYMGINFSQLNNQQHPLQTKSLKNF